MYEPEMLTDNDKCDLIFSIKVTVPASPSVAVPYLNANKIITLRSKMLAQRTHKSR